MTASDPQSETIRRLNDEFRRTGAGGHIMVTPGIGTMPQPEQLAILSAVQTFNAFSAHNDPHGEHDFGSIEHSGQKVFFKIDYYDNTLQCGSEDPADPQQTTRVMTIMLAHEY